MMCSAGKSSNSRSFKSSGDAKPVAPSSRSPRTRTRRPVQRDASRAVFAASCAHCPTPIVAAIISLISRDLLWLRRLPHLGCGWDSGRRPLGDPAGQRVGRTILFRPPGQRPIHAVRRPEADVGNPGVVVGQSLPLGEEPCPVACEAAVDAARTSASSRPVRPQSCRCRASSTCLGLPPPSAMRVM